MDLQSYGESARVLESRDCRLSRSQPMPCKEIGSGSSIQDLMAICRSRSTHLPSPRNSIACLLNKPVSPHIRIGPMRAKVKEKLPMQSAVEPRPTSGLNLAVHFFDFSDKLANRFLTLRTYFRELDPLPLLICPHDDTGPVDGDRRDWQLESQSDGGFSLQAAHFNLHSSTTEIPTHSAQCSRAHSAGDIGMEWGAVILASILYHSPAHHAEQSTKLVLVHGLLEIKGGSDREGSLHGLSLLTASNDDDGSGFIP